MKSIYVLSSETAGTKVGVSKSPPRRAVSIGGQKASNNYAVYFQTEPRADAYAVEFMVHEILAPHRIRREWFDVTPEEARAAVVDVLERLKANPAYAPPGSNRMRRYHARNRERGIVRIAVVVPIESAQQVRDLAHALRAQRQIDQPFTPEDDTP